MHSNYPNTIITFAEAKKCYEEKIKFSKAQYAREAGRAYATVVKKSTVQLTTTTTYTKCFATQPKETFCPKATSPPDLKKILNANFKKNSLRFVAANAYVEQKYVDVSNDNLKQQSPMEVDESEDLKMTTYCNLPNSNTQEKTSISKPNPRKSLHDNFNQNQNVYRRGTIFFNCPIQEDAPVKTPPKVGQDNLQLVDMDISVNEFQSRFFRDTERSNSVLRER